MPHESATPDSTVPYLSVTTRAKLIEFSPDAVVTVDERGRIVWLNSETETMFGYSRHELVGQPVELLIPERSRTAHSSHRERYFKSAERRPMGQGALLHGRRKDRSEFPVDILLSPVRGCDDHPIVLAVIRDVTERHRAENEIRQAQERIRESERQLRLLTEVIPQQIWSSDPAGSIDYCNQPLLEYVGRTMDQMRGSCLTDPAHPDDRDRVITSWQAALSDGTPLATEWRVQRADGDYRWFFSRALPLRATGGQIIRWYGTNTDIEDRKRAEQALLDTQTELAGVARLTTMGELAASIAHEVNQPLAAIVTNANACLRWLGSGRPNLQETREAVERIVEDGHRASDVIRRIRALLAKSATPPSPQDVNQVVHQALAFVRDRLSANRVVVRTNLSGHLPPVRGDRVQLQQVVLNLLINAIEAMAGVADRRRTLQIRSDVDERHRVVVSVRDTGAGIAAGDTDRLFDPFFTTKPDGMGLGLSISRSIVEAHGGELWAAADEGEGATFAFALPTGTDSHG